MIASVRTKKVCKIAITILFVLCITALHYRTSHLDISSHIIFRELYFLPIGLAGYWFGIFGAIGTSLFVTFLYLPFVLALPEGLSGHNFGNIIQIIIFNIFGLFAGYLREREERQKQKLLEAESLAAMGKAVSYVAHDMKTPLMAVGGFVRQVRRKIADQQLAEKLDLAFEQVTRLEVLVSDMLAFARPLKLDYQLGIINQLIEEIKTTSAEKAVRHSVAVRTDLQEDLPQADYDRHRMYQALLNLVNNALEASPAGSEIIIKSRYRDGGIVIEISDCGCGIPVEMIEDIYTPFVTTKKEGTGLGLAITKKIIDAHAGSIHISRNRDKGVTFRINIPLSR